MRSIALVLRGAHGPTDEAYGRKLSYHNHGNGEVNEALKTALLAIVETINMECKFEENDNTADFSLEDEPTPMRRRIALEDFVGFTS